MFSYRAAVPGKDDAHLHAVLSLYDTTFPDAAKVPLSEAERSWRAGKRRIWLAFTEEGFGGFAMTMPLPLGNGELLEYLAVAHQCRNMGLGSGLLAHLRITLRSEGVSRILAECRHPASCGDRNDRDMALRRLAFYGRNGALAIARYPIHYCPNFSGERVTRRILLQFPLAGPSEPTETEMAQDLLDIFLRSYLGVEEYFSQAVPR